MPQALLIARDMQNQLRRIPAGLRAWMPLLPQTVNGGKGYNESDDFPSIPVILQVTCALASFTPPNHLLE
ncbi:hypothetical protein Pcaca04_25850 [Pectobacterium carotovorum subsp. carotovorum]|nr:hypothetical protein Pcaca04_25850 [Pectobacterium carotovorum subsp. carotovorum]